MKGNMFKKALVVGIIFLFIGVGVYPSFAAETSQATYIIKEEETETKEYLFKTITHIEDNPDIKGLLDNIEARGVLSKSVINFLKRILDEPPPPILCATLSILAVILHYLGGEWGHLMGELLIMLWWAMGCSELPTGENCPL